MGRRLSILCCPCLPRKQRDNLSSRSLYPDQDSSGQDDYYSDDDNDHYSHRSHAHSHFHPNSRSRLELDGDYAAASNINSTSNTDNNNPWPSGFSNGRFSRHANKSSFGRSSQRKPNPFRTPAYRDEASDDGEDADEGTPTGVTSFAPYRDDESDNDHDHDHDHGHNSNDKQTRAGAQFQDKNALNDQTRFHPKMEYTPYSVQQAPVTSRRLRAPRNPQGKMAWDDEEQDAEEVIDVDALIAEQERITRELVAQEDALRQQEEAAIVSKRMAAIRAAESRGLLRFEGDQLVIPNSAIQQDNDKDDDGAWNYSRRTQQHPMERTTSSAASSFVGGIDAFNQELKMMTLDMSQAVSKRDNIPSVLAVPAVRPTPTRSSTSTSTATWSSAVETMPTSSSTVPVPISAESPVPASALKAVSTGVSTSTSTSTGGGRGTTLTIPGQSVINPRGVFNNIASFLKKVDGVIAGESGDSSDEASFSDKEQEQGSQQQQQQQQGQSVVGNSSKTPQGQRNGPQGLVSTIGEDNKRTSTDTGSEAYSIRAADSQQVATMAIPLYSEERPYPEDPFNTLATSPGTRDEDKVSPSSPAVKYKSPTQSQPFEQLATTTTSTSAAGAAQETIYNTFTSLFNTGSSLMGFFGGGGVAVGQSHDDHEGGGRRLSSLKYGDPKKHQFNYKDHHLEDKEEAKSRAIAAAAAAADDDDDDSIDDYNF